MKRKFSYFSISNEIIPSEDVIKYDLFVNSSVLSGKERFVRFFKRGCYLKQEHLDEFIDKYKIIYVCESQRKYYLRDLLKTNKISECKKAAIIKDYAIDHLEVLFKDGGLIQSKEETFERELKKCQDSVEYMVDFVQDKKISDIQEMLGELSYHDFYTYDHSINVALYAIVFCRFLKPKAKREELVAAGLGGLLHDLGKSRVPNSILNNTGKLTDEDLDIIKKHPNYGVDLFEEHSFVGLSPYLIENIKGVIYEHHENVNGTGYPNKKNSDEICEMAKIISIVDFFDAITSKRSYHEPLSVEDSINLMSQSVNEKIDEKMFNKFKECVDQVVFKGKEYIKVSEDFDPCLQYRKLPIHEIPPDYIDNELLEKEKEEYGKVKVVPDKKKVA